MADRRRPAPHVQAARDLLLVAFAEQLEAHRKARGWSLTDEARAAGLSQRQVRRLEKAAANPSLSTLLARALAYGLQVTLVVHPADMEVPCSRQTPTKAAS